MTEDQAVAWLLLEGWRVFQDKQDGEYRWVNDDGIPRTIPCMYIRRPVRFSGFPWTISEFTKGHAWDERTLESCRVVAPAVVKLLTEKENEP